VARVGDAQNDITYQAAQRMVDNGLRRDDSLFTPGRPIWSLRNFSDIQARFVDQPDTTNDSFENKFRRQLAGAPAETVQLAAELLYVNLLISRQMRGDTKRERIAEVLSWAGTGVTIPPELSAALDHGLINPGTAYVVQKPFGLVFLVRFLLRWKGFSESERTSALADPWAFKTIVSSIPAPSAQAQQAALLHLVFPDSFEAIVSGKHKERIARTFAEGSESDEPDIDRRLLAVRTRLTPEFGDRYSYYRSPLLPRWSPATDHRDEPPIQPATTSRVWIEKTLVSGRTDRTTGSEALGVALWSPQRSEDGRDYYRTMREVKPGDVVLHFVDNRAFVGVSRVVSPPDDSVVGVSGTDWADRPAIRVGLGDYLVLDPPLERTELFGPEDIRRQLQQIRQDHRGLFYNKSLELNQGSYLTEAPPALVSVLSSIYRAKTGRPLPYVDVTSAIAPASPTPATPPVPTSVVTLDMLSELTLWPKSSLEEIVDLFETNNRQVVFAGPPGTSKTWIAQLIAQYLCQGDPRRHRLVQFHPSYTYEAFVEGLRPTLENGAIQFSVVPGIVRKFVQDIGTRLDAHVLIVDEMNRANLPKVLGELMYLFEYRNKTIDLPYTKNFKLPDNLWFIGTMNTADRSIRSIDVALRRRFMMIDCPPDAGILQRYYLNGRENQVENLLEGFTALNLELTRLLDEHHTIGHAFFMVDGFDRLGLERAWRHKIGPLIQEYFFDQPDTARAFTIERFWPAAD
jgi:5-methylcytosine-specific restriction enzyme B